MPRRGENIHKRKDGRWEARYKKGVDKSGAALYGSVYAKTYREVKAKQQARMLSIEKNETTSKGYPLFRDVVYLWLDDIRIRLKGATECRYRNLIETHIISDLGDRSLSQINSTVINTYLADKLEHGRVDGTGGLSPAYVRSIMLVIKSVLSYAASNNMCPPLQAKINKPPVVAKELPILTREDQGRLESVCITDIDETKAGVLLSLYAGLRIGEVCALEWTDIDLQRKLIHIRKTVSRVKDASAGQASRSVLIIDRPKTPSSQRDIPLCSWLVPILEQLRCNTASKYVTSNDAQFVSPRTYDYRYHKLLSAAGIPPVNYHALRHTFATRCIEAGVDVKSLSEMLGHTDASITLNTYVHSSMDRKRQQLEKLSL